VSAFFVTATGTDIGKTYITAGLIRALRAQGRPASAIKPVISGFDMAAAETTDSGVLLQAMEKTVTQQSVVQISPWRFREPLSPDMAAARENRTIDFAELVAFCRNEITPASGKLFIEGVGGVMVPLDARHTVLDWIAALDIPAILVAGTYLGTISHTLTALDALVSRGVAIQALVMNESENAPVPIAETIATIGRFVPNISIIAILRRPDAAGGNASFEELSEYLEAAR
jgi:dethiobiotin synthetase